VTRGEPLSADATPDEIESALVVAFAGEAAEKYADRATAPVRNGNRHDPWFTAGEMEALVEVAETADSPSDGDVVDHYRERLGAERVERARSFAVELVWRLAAVGQLSLLAQQIFERHHLTSTEIEEILEGREPS
jgi:hypothetical protein